MSQPFTFELNFPPGIISDDSDFAAAGRWVDSNGVRFRLGRPETHGGYSGHPDFIGTLTGTPRNIFYNGGQGFVGTSSRLYLNNGITSNITPGGIGSSIVGWAFGAWGDNTLAVPSGGTLYDVTAGSSEITQAPDQITWMLVTQERQVLALGCNEELSGTFNPRCIRGSDIEDNTNWTTTNQDNAFEHILEGGGDIVTGRVVGQYVAVWTVGALWIGQFLGNPAQAYRFEMVDDRSGCVGPNAVVAVDGTAYYVGLDLRLRAWQPGTVPVVIPCTVFQDFSANINRSVARQIFLWHNSAFNEIWIHYPDTRDATSECSRYIAYSIGESVQAPVWFRGTLNTDPGGPATARTAVLDSGLVQQYLNDNYPSFKSTVVAASLNGNVFLHERSTIPVTTWSLTSGDQYLDNGRRRVHVQRFVPDFDTRDGTIALTVYAKDRPASTAVTKGPYTVLAAAKKLDFRASGMILSAKLEGSSVTMRMGKPYFECVPGGGR